MTTTNKENFRSALEGGAVAGIIGGLVIAAFIVLMSASDRQDVWPALKGAAAPFLGERASAPGFDFPAVVLGVLSHLVISLIWGALFGVVAYGLAPGATVIFGTLYGVVVWIVMFYVVLPTFGLSATAAAVPPGRAVLEHVLFGLGVGFGFLPYQRRLDRPVAAPPPIERPA